MDMEDSPQCWNSTNLVGLPAGLIASVEFNAHPRPLNIAGVRESHRGLFQLLAGVSDMAEATGIFRHYMEITFGLAPPTPECKARSAAASAPAI